MCAVLQERSHYVTREGYKAYVLGKTDIGEDVPSMAYIGYVIDFDGNVAPSSWHSNGHINEDNAPHECDIEEAPLAA
jgi:hypothetical protein